MGIMNVESNGYVNEFEEKPEHPKSTLASMGIYVFTWSKLKKYLIENENANTGSKDFGKDIIPAMLAGGENITEGWEGHGNTNQHCSSSMNHFGLGSVVGWMFEYLGGIRWRESTPGFAHVVLRPCFVPAMHAFAAKFQSVNGGIDTKGTGENGVAVYEFETAVNGTLILPDGTVQSFEPGKHRVTAKV